MQRENQVLKHHSRERNSDIKKSHNSRKKKKKKNRFKEILEWERETQWKHSSRERKREWKKKSINLDRERDGGYWSTAERTSFLSIFPPTPDARSNAPAFDIAIFPKITLLKKTTKTETQKSKKALELYSIFCCCNIMQIVLVCEIFYMEEEEERGSQIGNGEVFRVEATRKRERKVRNLRFVE